MEIEIEIRDGIKSESIKLTHEQISAISLSGSCEILVVIGSRDKEIKAVQVRVDKLDDGDYLDGSWLG